MEVSSLTFQLAIIFLPGVLWHSLSSRLMLRQQRSPTEVTLRAFGFGISSYAIYFLLYFIVDDLHPFVAHMTKVPDRESLASIRPEDVMLATLVALVMAIFWSASVNRKWFIKLMQVMKVTRKFGDESVWDFVLNLSIPNVEFVNVRDFEHKVIYSGYVKAFSEGTATRELFLEDVVVYDLETSTVIYEVPFIYLSRKVEGMHLDFPFTS